MSKASETEIEKKKLPNLASTAHWGTLAIAGMTVKFILVQSSEQRQREDVSALSIF